MSIPFVMTSTSTGVSVGLDLRMPLFANKCIRSLILKIVQYQHIDKAFNISADFTTHAKFLAGTRSTSDLLCITANANLHPTAINEITAETTHSDTLTTVGQRITIVHAW